MIKIQQLDTNNNTVYIVDCVDDWNEFTEWLYNLEDEEISVMLCKTVYHFRSLAERRFFVFGFSKAWDVIDEEYVKKYKGDN
jgi:hypothetical protein